MRGSQHVSLDTKGDCQNWHLEVTLLGHAVCLVQHQEAHPGSGLPNEGSPSRTSSHSRPGVATMTCSIPDTFTALHWVQETILHP